MSGLNSFTKFLAHFNGTDESTTYTPDSSSNNYDIQADDTTNTKIDTTAGRFKFGTAGLNLRSANAYVYINASPPAALGAGDWSVDFWLYKAATPANADYTIFDFRPGGPTNGAYATLYMKVVAGVATLRYFANSADRIVGAITISYDALHHIMVSRVSGTTRLFVDGVAETLTYTDGTTYLASNLRPIIGANGNGASGIGDSTSAWLDEFRIQVGEGTSANFTPPTAEYSGSTNVDGVLTAAGVGAAAFTSIATKDAVFSSAGIATAPFVSSAQKDAVLAVAGLASVAFAGQFNKDFDFTAGGISTVQFVSLNASDGVWTAAGSGAAVFVGSILNGSVLSAAGVGSAAFVGNTVLNTALLAQGLSTCSFFSPTVDGAFTMQGLSGALFVGSPLGWDNWIPETAPSNTWTPEGSP